MCLLLLLQFLFLFLICVVLLILILQWWPSLPLSAIWCTQAACGLGTVVSCVLNDMVSLRFANALMLRVASDVVGQTPDFFPLTGTREIFRSNREAGAVGWLNEVSCLQSILLRPSPLKSS